jgi:hypothetical protein
MPEYTKPEIAVLGDASRLIEGAKVGVGDQGNLHFPGPITDETSD